MSNSITCAQAGAEGARISWNNTTDPTARTAPARAAFESKFLEQADGDPVAAAELRKAYYARLGHLSAQARRKRRHVDGDPPAAPSEAGSADAA